MFVKKTLDVLVIFCITLVAGCSQQDSFTSLNRKIAESQPQNTWVASNLDSIASYFDSVPANIYDLYLAKGDIEHVQIAFKTDSADSYIIERFAESKTDIAFTSRNLVHFNRSDDVLVPTSGKVRVADSAKLWLTYSTTQQTKAGTYNEIVRFKANNREFLFKIRLHVYNCALPEIPTIPSVMGIDPNRMGIKGLSEEEASIEKKKWSDLLLTFRISPYFSNWIGQSLETKDMRVENISSPWAWNDPRTIEYMNDPRFTSVALPSHFLSDDELNKFLDVLRKNDLLKKAYFYIWDEPARIGDYALIQKEAARIKKFAPDARVLTSFYCGPKDGPQKDDLFAVFDYLKESTDIFCQGVWSLSESELRADSCRRAALNQGAEWWTYVCMSDYPGLSIANNFPIRNRAVMWRVFKEQSSGFLYWVVNSFDSINPLVPRQNLPHGDGILIFPGEQFGLDNELVVSSRLERWRDGVEDYELLKLLESKNGREASLELLKLVHINSTSQTKHSQEVVKFKKRLLEQLSL